MVGPNVAARRSVAGVPAGSVGSLIDSRVVTVRAETCVGEATETARRAPSLLRKYLYFLGIATLLAGLI